MAKSVVSDDEFGIDIDDDDYVSSKFTAAANHLQTLLPTVDKEILVTLYGLYKQALEGPCNTSKPTWFDQRGRYKWEAWNKLGDMPSSEAKERYVEMIRQLDPTFSTKTVRDTGWVTVSTLATDDGEINDGDKTIVDYIKEANLERTGEILRSYNKRELREALGCLDSMGMGVVHWASDRGSVPILQELISHGADVNLRDEEGQTPLHYAAVCDHVECARLLLEKGADINARDKNGDKPSSDSDEMLSLFSKFDEVR